MRILFMILLTAITLGLNAQQISGITKDAQGVPVNGATISLLKAKDSSVVKLAVSKENGAYSFINIKEGAYRVKVSHVGFAPLVSAPFTISTGDVTVPELQLSKSAGDMKGVIVTAQKPMVEVRADKTIVNVEGTINAAGQDALELLRKSPGVTVDKDENLTVNGKNGVQVYVDGRPTPLSGSDLANYLKSMQSSQIEAIEIITNPSAKYEAAGNAGIINIRLKRNKAFGTNGSVNAGYAIGVYSKYNAGINLNYRNKNINLYGTYSYSKGLNQSNISLYRTVLDTLFDQNGIFKFDNQNHNFKLGADYTINKTSSIGAIVNGTFADPRVSNYSKTPISYLPTGVVNRILVADNHSNLKRNNYNINVNYNYTSANGKSLVLNADRGYYNLNSDQYQPNFYYEPDGKTLQSSVVYRMIAPTIIHINSGKVDYEENFYGGKLGAGGKISFVNTDNNFQRYNVINSVNELDQDRSNIFKYKENINAGYVNWNKAYKKGFAVQAGLRVENTVSTGTSNGQKNVGGTYQPSTSEFKRNYTSFFPSAALTFNKNPMNQLTLSYSRRIDRPAYQDLNPFEFKLDEYTFQRGNTNLRPQYTNSFEVTNVYKYRLTSKFNYSHVSDLFTQIIDTAEKSKSFISKKNLATQNIVSFNISYPFQYKSYSVFANLNTNYSMYKADFGTGRKIDLNAFGASLFAQNSLKFAKVWTAELTGFYNAPSIYQGTFKAKSLWSVDAGLQKQIFKGMGTVKASVSDVFHSLRFNGTSDFAGQVTKVNARWEAQQFKLNFNFRFGSNTIKGAKQKGSASEEENKRAQQQAGGLGIGNN